MFDALDDIKSQSSVGLVLLSIMLIFASGIWLAIIYFAMEATQEGFEATDCVIENNVYVDSCQELWELALYPFLEMRSILIWFSFFFIFALVLGMLLAGYQSGSSPAMMGIYSLFVMILTYFGIELSNVYRTMLETDLFRSMMVNFTVYNKIMLYFPWFTFFVGLFSVMLGVINYQKSHVNSDADTLNY